MPAAMQYLPFDKQQREQADSELAARRELCGRSLAYYQGDHKKHLRTTGKHDDNTVINMWKTAVDREVSFLFPDMVRLELSEIDETEAEDVLRKGWDANQGARALRKMARNGCLYGHVFVKIVPPRNPASALDTDRYPRLLVLPTANMLAWWKADDAGEVLWYENRWTVGGMDYRQDTVRTDGGWLIVDWQREADSSGYRSQQTQAAWEKVGEATWNYALGPVLDWPHLDPIAGYYGDNEAKLLDLNDRINKSFSDVARILRYHASPRTIGTGMSADKVVETAIDSFYTVEDPQAKIYNLEMQSDLASSMQFITSLKEAFLAQKRVVVMTGSAADFQRVTNYGVKTIFIDPLAKVGEVQSNYRYAIISLSQRMRMLLGEPDYYSEIRVRFPDPLPADPKESIDVLKEQDALGIVSKETMAREQGLNWDEEQARMMEENTSPMENLLRRDARATMLPPAPPLATSTGNE